MASNKSELDERVLVLTPVGRDADLTARILENAGVSGMRCPSAKELCVELSRGAAAVIVVEEALDAFTRKALSSCLSGQPAWSDVPLLVVVAGDRVGLERLVPIDTITDLGNVTILERPMRTVILLSAVKAALRARRRQYEVRDLLRELERGVRARDTFLATLSHELRNPLGAIRYAIALLDRAHPDRSSNDRAVLRRQCDHMSRLVDELLDVSRVTSGKIILQRETIDLVDSVRRGIEAEIDVARGDHALRLRAEVGPIYVDADPVRIEQVVRNLLTNAVKYTPVGKSIDVVIDRVGADARIVMRDEGVGLTPELVERIFELFAQADRTLDRSQGGLGIGLTLSRRLIELHGGTIVARSDGPGRGSTFEVRLPAVEAPAAVPSIGPERASGPPVARRLLLVEDNEDIRETLSLLLESHGFDVRVAVDGPSGVHEALRNLPDTALVDIGLPGFDGYEVARRLRAKVPHTRLIALTGYGQPDDRRRSQEAGFDAHLTKPIDIGALVELICAPTIPPIHATR